MFVLIISIRIASHTKFCMILSKHCRYFSHFVMPTFLLNYENINDFCDWSFLLD